MIKDNIKTVEIADREKFTLTFTIKIIPTEKEQQQDDTHRGLEIKDGMVTRLK